MADTDEDKPEEKPKIRRPKRAMPQVFSVVRNQDESGVSGTGEVAAGVIMSSGKVLLEWFSATPSLNQYDSFDAFLAVHVDPHPENDTEVHWLYGGPEDGDDDVE